MAIAAPSQVLVSQAVRELVAGFECRVRGELYGELVVEAVPVGGQSGRHVLVPTPMDAKPDVPRGIFTGFDEYLQPTEDEYRELLTAGLVVLDTNVLLNLYRYNVKVQDELVDVLKALGDRVWIPHQVLVEFWRNHETVLEESDRGAESIIEELKGHEERTLEAFRRWARRFALQEDETSRLAEAVSEGFARMIEGIQALAEADATAESGPSDLVLEKLEPVLEGRVGAPMDLEAYNAAVRESARRVRDKSLLDTLTRARPEGPERKARLATTWCGSRCLLRQNREWLTSCS